MNRRWLFMMSLVLMTPFFGRAKGPTGERLPDRLEFEGTTLVLNGSGVRSVYFIDAYIAGLYLKQRMQDPNRIIEADEAMAVRMQIVSSLITPERMEQALRDAFNRATDGDLAPIRDQVDQFIEAFKTGISEGDVYDVVYLPGKGVQVYKNGVLRASARGMAFKRACFATWLGKNPVQASLKRALLGL